MSRAYGEVFVRALGGRAMPGVAVDILDPNTDVRIPETVYADDTGVLAISLPTVTDSSGKVPFYLDSGKQVRARATVNGVTYDDIINVEDPTATAVLGADVLTTGGAQTKTGALTAPLQDKGGQVFNVVGYAADPTGVTESVTAFQAAYAALVAANGGTLLVPPGVYNCNKAANSAVLQLVRDNAQTRGLTHIQIAPGATIKLGANTPRFLDLLKVADYDWFGNLQVDGGGTIDANSIGGQHHVVIGTYAGGATLSRIDIEHVRVADLKVINVPVDPTIATHRLNVWFAVAHSGAGETQTVLRDIVVDNLRMEGGNAGVGIMGSGPAVLGINVFIDDVHIHNCWHSLMAVQLGAGWASSNYHIGSRGFGGRGCIKDCQGYYSGDVGIETNAMTTMTISKCHMEDARLANYFHANYSEPADIAAQRVTYTDCMARRVLQTDSINSAQPGWVFWNTTVAGGVALGDIVLDRCTHFNGAGITPSDAYGDGMHFDAIVARSIQLSNFSYVNTGGWNYSSGSSRSVQLMRFTPAGGCRVVLRNLSLQVAGQRSGAGSLVMVGVGIGASTAAGAGVTFDIDGVAYTSTVTGMGAGSNEIIGRGGSVAGSLVRGTVRNVRLLALDAADTTPIGMRVGALATYTVDSLLIVENMDMSQGPAGSLAVVFASATENRANTRLANVRSGSSSFPSAAVAITPGASPYSYQNLDGARQTVVVSGGTVSAIAISRDNTIFTSAGVIAGAFPVDAGDYLRVTYSVVPTMTKILAR